MERVYGYWYKTEDPYTVIETKAGGKTEVLGGLLYPGQGATAVPATDIAC